MSTIKVVIGANFGDEGKGLMTDYFSSVAGEDSLVVRFNGGAQAGHTVQTPDGKRHVFSHFGSGSLCGVSTFLSSYFVVNPILFCQEYQKLEALGILPDTYVDEKSIVSTPYDMLINQLSETSKGSSRHGSCGLGINETIERTERGYAVTMYDLGDLRLLSHRLNIIRQQYVPKRLSELGITEIPESFKELFYNENLIENYLADVWDMMRKVKVTDVSFLTSKENLIFEGAQGLLLDQDSKYFPHVTRSNTGLKNASELIKSAGLSTSDIEVVYVTRAYFTRHGAGPFYSEVEGKPYSGIEDKTNIPNEFQGSLRFGIFDLDVFFEAVMKDLCFTPADVDFRIAVTCVDQIYDTVYFNFDGSFHALSVPDFIKKVADTVGTSKCYVSYGPTRATIELQSV